MSYDYEIINHITNEDYKSCSRDLPANCREIEDKYNAGEYAECCRLVRKTSEGILRYLYERLSGGFNRGRAPMAGEILHDNRFLIKLNNIPLADAAGNVQRIGSKYAHEGKAPNETEQAYEARLEYEKQLLPSDTNQILENFSLVLQLGITYINEKISGVRGTLTLTFRNSIDETTGAEEFLLESNLSDVKDRFAYTRQWKVLGRNGTLPQKGYILRVQPWMAGKTIIVEMTNNETGQVLSAQYGPLRPDEVPAAPVQGPVNTPRTNQPPKSKPTGDVQIHFKPCTERGKVRNYLQAEVVASDCPESLYYMWFRDQDDLLFKGQDKNACYLSGRDDLIGTKLTCKANNRDLGFFAKTKKPFGPITEDMVKRDYSKEPLPEKEEPAPAAKDTAAPVSQPETPVLPVAEEKKPAAQPEAPAVPAEPDTIPMTVEEEETPARQPEVSVVQPEPDIIPMTVEEEETPARQPETPAAPVEPTTVPMTVEEEETPTREPEVPVVQSEPDTVPMTAEEETPAFQPEVPAAKEETERPKAPDETSKMVAAPDTAAEETVEMAAHARQPRPEKEKPGCTLAPTERPPLAEGPRFRCFDSNISRLHYLIAPRNEYFATNALEYLDYNAFLHALLKEQGYQRVIIVGNTSEDEGDNYPVLAYDELSQQSFLHAARFEEAFGDGQERSAEAFERFCRSLDKAAAKGDNPIRAQMGGRRTPAAKKKTAVSRFGKRVIRTIIRPSANGQAEAALPAGEERKPKELFEAFITTEVCAALKSDILKTAIVMPLELLLEQGYLTNMVIRRLNENITAAGNNVIIITADQEEDLYRLFSPAVSEVFQRVDNTINRAVSRLQGSSGAKAYCQAFVDELSADGRIFIAAGHPGKDEIANLLIRMKVKGDRRLADLPYAKIYALAEFITTRCDSSDRTKEEFRDLANNTWYVGSLRNLEVALRDDEVVKALVKKAGDLWNREIRPVSGMGATSLERIYAAPSRTEKTTGLAPVGRAVISDSEKQAEYERASGELNELVGLEAVKEKLQETFANAIYGGDAGPGHYIFSGNPGTGKTVVARLMGKILHAQGLLEKGHVVEVMKADLVADHIGGSGIKTREKCEEALDGVLFIDEAYQLVNTDDSTSEKFSSPFDREAYTTLMAFMENNRKRLCVICAGYPHDMRRFREANDGMSRRIPESNIITFPDYSPEELYEILRLMAKNDGLPMTDGFAGLAKSALRQMWENRDEKFGNAGDVRNFLDDCRGNAARRSARSRLASLELREEDIPADYREENHTVQERLQMRKAAMQKLDEMVGLQNVKKQLKTIINRKLVMSKSKNGPGSYIFAGNPGTGKTAVARMVGEILKANGLLKKGHTVEVSKADLVAEYVGMSSIKAREQCRKALDGVLFVDEAYELVNTDPGVYGKFSSKFDEEAYTTIMKFMEDNASRICVIFAGYKDKMEIFKEANSGMASRIKATIDFEDYSDEELMEIMKLLPRTDPNFAGVELTPAFLALTRNALSVMRRDKEFGNARTVKRYLDACVGRAADRIVESGATGAVDRITILPEDIPEVYRRYIDALSGSEPAAAAEETRPVETGLGLIPRSVIAELPDPYGSEEARSEDFPERCRASVLRLETEYGSATAFVISPDGYAITCAHAVSEKGNFANLARKKRKAFFQNGTVCDFIIKNTRPDLDMALIRIRTEESLPYLKLAPEDRKIRFGEDCVLYGYPSGRVGIMQAPGTVSTEGESVGDGELGEIYYFSGNAEPGDSGGPIIARHDGCVIGVLRGARGPQGRADFNKYNYMKPVRYFWKEFLK